MLGWELPPYNSGGLGVVCYHLAKALADQGADIDFVLPSCAEFDASDFMNISRPGISSRSRNFSKPFSVVANPYLSDISTVREIQAEYDEYVMDMVKINPPDVIHAHDWLTLGAGMKAKQASQAPLIAHVHATEFDRAGGKSGNPLIHEIEYQGLMMADHIVAVSNATKNIIVKNYHIPANKIEVIHNSAEALPEHITEIAEYRYLQRLKEEGYIVVATIGRLTVQKGLTHFLRAAAAAHHRFNRLVFLIAGDGDQRDELISLSADFGIADAVLFTGFVRGKAWRDVYNLADVFVMSSISEPFGLTALEAAQHDTAISLTNQSGAGEVLSNALHYDYWDERRLADQLVSLALSDSLRTELSRNARHEVNQMSWHKVASRFTDRYLRLTEASA
jgi:glycosyltransferase involved in cell wall biosynthesis